MDETVKVKWGLGSKLVFILTGFCSFVGIWVAVLTNGLFFLVPPSVAGRNVGSFFELAVLLLLPLFYMLVGILVITNVFREFKIANLLSQKRLVLSGLIVSQVVMWLEVIQFTTNKNLELGFLIVGLQIVLFAVLSLFFLASFFVSRFLFHKEQAYENMSPAVR